jgi:bifunctional non-homologous end joining protein LigD
MLEKYNRKRNFAKTPEPAGNSTDRPVTDNRRRFVIQKHDARRLHYDFRLETENRVLRSWAVPKGISLNSKVKRLAILTEDHPLDYLLFEGTIPEGNYGAGTVLVWDTGFYTLEKSNARFSEQFDKGKITFLLHGQKVNGKFSLIRTSQENQWLIIKYVDQFVLEEDLTTSMPDSVLSQTKKSRNKKKYRANNQMNPQLVQNNLTAENSDTPYRIKIDIKQLPSSELPNRIRPMLSTPVEKPFNDKKWEFEIKWDGVRAILFYSKSKNVLELKSRTNKSIGHRYPEISKSIPSSSVIRCKDSVVLDGEIVVLDEQGHPDFQSHQRRMNLDHDLDIQSLSREIPATFYIFDILYLDGKELENLEFWKRRDLLSNVINMSHEGNNVIRISESFEEKGIELFENIKARGLEGIIAKKRNSRYLQGARTADWLKIKNLHTQDCVVIGYTRGEGNRKNYFGSLLLAAAYNKEFVFIGHSGSGFDGPQIIDIFNKLQEIRSDGIPVSHVPYTNRDPVWVRPLLVVEVKFDGWTKEMIMRAPIFLRIRDDKKPRDCTLEKPKSLSELSSIKPQYYEKQNLSSSVVSSPPSSTLQVPSSGLSSSELASSNTNSTSASTAKKLRGGHFTNLDKVFWSKNTFHRDLTKEDLIEYYDKISSYLLPLLRDRPLSLSRYPDGVTGKHFYQKNWNMKKPEFVNSVKIYSESARRSTNYLICNNKETLLWLVNLGCIEIHPWYSRVVDYDACLKDSGALDEEKCGLNCPDFVVFDLDPYIYSGLETSAEEEPEYNHAAFKETMKIAQLLKIEVFDILKIKAYIKTSGKTGIHIFVPVSTGYTYDQTRNFAEAVGRILINKEPDRITMDWSTSKRRGKIFFDHNQNAKGKTLAAALSARPTPHATISMPLEWEIIDRILPTDFTIQSVKEKLGGERDFKKSVTSWSNILESRQDLSKLLEASK